MEEAICRVLLFGALPAALVMGVSTMFCAQLECPARWDRALYFAIEMRLFKPVRTYHGADSSLPGAASPLEFDCS